MNIQGWHIAILVVLAILLFGAPKLPGLARSVGQSLRIFKSEVRQMKDENTSDTASSDPVEGRVVNNPVDLGKPAAQAPPATPGAHGAAAAPGTDQRPAGNPPTSL
ncbi:Sec-independent protein translocase subunit TatA [Arthrobacter jiangjiafuii]|uniref:Sec-independent protein translocase protein TatA n=1 Tax=Arthrobacter jiangjiafuii TaxID=2817475 RepID=A0A975QZ37_9MICC|nr:Sec-independent protein translocase subunit TatA [Arthrobacter jiangjiafuii]MBP3043131.1 Sec-independent protein translocase subunit TatA [Arthrobacter jiangjiafuii]QWC08687.1 Sec-independent protein translocase subunit TatA [Arthrobacter jiangjiafuii]